MLFVMMKVSGRLGNFPVINNVKMKTSAGDQRDFAVKETSVDPPELIEARAVVD